jgi:hypothetical protein
LATLEDAARFVGLVKPWRPAPPHWDFAAELLLRAAQIREESHGRIDAPFDRIYSRSIGEAMGMLPDRGFCAELSLATIGPMSGASQKGGFPCVQRS